MRKSKTEKLMEWVNSPFRQPKIQHLARYIANIRQAVEDDKQRTQLLLEDLNKMEDKIGVLAEVVHKQLADDTPIFSDGEIRTYASARINQRLIAEVMNRPLTPENKKLVRRIAFECFEETRAMGAGDAIIEDMKVNFLASIKVEEAGSTK